MNLFGLQRGIGTITPMVLSAYSPRRDGFVSIGNAASCGCAAFRCPSYFLRDARRVTFWRVCVVVRVYTFNRFTVVAGSLTRWFYTLRVKTSLWGKLNQTPVLSRNTHLKHLFLFESLQNFYFFSSHSHCFASFLFAASFRPCQASRVKEYS